MLKKMALLIVPLAVIAAVCLASCGKTQGANGTNSTGGSSSQSCPSTQTINLVATDFAIHCATVKANTPVTFNDPTTSGGVHIICIGHNGACQSGATGPSALMKPGFMIQPGQTHQVTFTIAGTYHLACTIHPTMNMIVIVQ